MITHDLHPPGRPSRLGANFPSPATDPDAGGAPQRGRQVYLIKYRTRTGGNGSTFRGRSTEYPVPGLGDIADAERSEIGPVFLENGGPGGIR
jgi:hypothetical protein